MRGGQRRRHQEEEEESAFVSMTDMVVSFLFIVMILLAFFASQITDDKTVPLAQFQAVQSARDAAVSERDSLRTERDSLEAKLRQLLKEMSVLESRAEILQQDNEVKARTIDALREELRRSQRALADAQKQVAVLEEAIQKLKRVDPLESYLASVANQRREILETLRNRLNINFPDLQVVVTEEMDALRFKGDGLFERGVSSLSPEKRRIVESIASRLNEILPCYTIGSRSNWQQDCNPVGAIIEAVQIEGHTDSDGQANSNMTLSTARANATFFAMIEREPNLIQHLNSRKQPVLSVAGYGAMRPIADNSTVEGKATNRRIDLRIIMYTPPTSQEIDTIRDRLQRGVASDMRP